MAELKNPKYLKGLKELGTSFKYKVSDNGQYFIDYDKGFSEIDNVVEKLKKLSTDLNTTSEDVKKMLSSYMLDDTVDLNGFVVAVNGSMNSMASEISKDIQTALHEAKDKMEKSKQADEEFVQKESEVNKQFDGDDKMKAYPKGAHQGSDVPGKTEESDRDLDEIKDAVDEFGGNNGHDIYKDAKKSGNEEIYKKNMNNLLDNLTGVKNQFDADGKGYSFESTVFSGGKHATGSGNPTHGMGAKADLRWYKDGVQLDVNNASQEDWEYIRSVLDNNNLGVQFEKQNTVWGDVFLKEAYNKNGEVVSYDGSNWGDDASIYYTK